MYPFALEIKTITLQGRLPKINSEAAIGSLYNRLLQFSKNENQFNDRLPFQKFNASCVSINLSYSLWRIPRVICDNNRGLVINQNFEHIQAPSLRSAVSWCPASHHARGRISAVFQEKLNALRMT